MANLTSNQLCNICRIHYNAGLRCCALGSAVEGGRLIAKTGGLAWIVAPSSTEVSSSWSLRGNAITNAQATSPCGDWFIPSASEMVLVQSCKAFWDSYASAASAAYWSNTETVATTAWFVNMSSAFYSAGSKTQARCVRAFRRVAY